MRTTRRTLLIGSALAAVAPALAACGADDAGGAASGASDQGGAGTRAVEHARGTAQVPEAPQRVIVLEPVTLDVAVALGVVPVGAAVASNIKGVPAYLGVDGVEGVGTVPEPDLEAIAALAPDLILGTESRLSALFDQLDSVAPTVFLASHAAPWQENALVIGEALNAKAKVEELVAAFEERAAEIGATHDVAGQTVSMIRPRDETTLSLYGPTSFAGNALTLVGLTIPDREWTDGIQADISPENILETVADHVFVTSEDPADESTLPAAVRENRDAFGKVTLVDTSYWVSGVGPLGGGRVLDDLELYLAENA